jgi:hypothetical protein
MLAPRHHYEYAQNTDLALATKHSSPPATTYLTLSESGGQWV